jgi:trimeric autotransporter adhesin
MADALQPARAALLEHRFTAPSPNRESAANGYNTDSTILEPGSRSGSRSTSHELHELAPVADTPRAPEQPPALVSQLRELPASQPATTGSALVRRTSWGGSASTADTRAAFAAAAAAAAAAPEPAQQQQAKANRKRQRSETVPGGHSQQDVKRVGSFGSSGSGPSSVSPRENSEADALAAAAPTVPARPPTSTILNYFHKKSSGSAAAASAHAPLRAADSSSAAHRRLLNATSGKASIDPIDLASPCQAPSSSVSSTAAAGSASYGFVQLQSVVVTQPSPDGTADSIAAARIAGDTSASNSSSASTSACSSGGSSSSSSSGNPNSSSNGSGSSSSSSSAAVDSKTAQQLMELRLQLAAAEERVAALQAVCAAERDKRRAADVAVTSLTAQMASMRVQFQAETAAAAARGAAKEQRAREALESLVSLLLLLLLFTTIFIAASHCM